MRPFLTPLIAAGAGGMSPYLVSLAKNLLSAGSTAHFSDYINWLYAVGLILVALIGAGAAFIFQETDLKKAFVIGIGAPALITTTFNSAESSHSTLTGIGTTILNLIPAAYADPLPSPSTANPVVRPSVHIELQSPIPIIVHFQDGNQGNVLSAFLQASGDLPIPERATGIQFETGGQVKSPSFPLPTGQSKTFTVTVTGQRTFGFNQSFFNTAPSINYQIAVNVH